MRILICGTNSEDAINHFKKIPIYYMKFAHSLSHFQQSYINDSSFADKMLLFANICSQAYIPGAINLYTMTPWSHKEIWNNTLPQNENTTVQAYYDLIGWKPDVIIYLYNDSFNLLYEQCFDVDNSDDVKIFKLYANESRIKENLMLILEKILSHYPRSKLQKISSHRQNRN